MFTVQRTGWRRVQIVLRGSGNRRPAVNGFSESVQNAAQQAGADSELRVIRTGVDGISRLQPVNFFERHRENPAIPEADNLGADSPAVGSLNLTEAANFGSRSLRLDHEARYVRDGAAPAKRVEARQILQIGCKANLFGHHRIERRSAKPRWISPSCESTEASRSPKVVSKTISPFLRLGSGKT